MERRYIASRIAQTIITLYAVLTLMWVLFRLVPGDPTAMFLSGRLSPEDVEAIRKLWGLDQPLHVQYFKYMKNLSMGDLGISFSYREPVLKVMLPALFNTLILMIPSILMAIVVGTLMGTNLGWKRGSARERIGVVLSLFVRSFPVFLTGIIVLMIFVHLLGWFPLGGMRTIGAFGLSWWERFLDVSHHLALPFGVAFLYYVGDVVVISRTSMLEMIGEEFLQFAKARGLSDKKVKKIAMRNAIIPVITYSTILIGFAFGGQVLLEVVFAWPGVGRLMVNSVQIHDYPVAQAAFFLMATAVIIANLLVDFSYGYLDPRISIQKR
ncbi:MAG: ABC transporter permease [Deltaproteobacteria bacterium]|nr:ABC transporter permease [Deltaproteobacteria bacterium]MBW1978884.1 ABC transporter permease [Deltaproteobacteria bacterium]MBW2045371.1 ABC transporter permease [Deltaproteobacteria bacterium]MBW2299171.1 ABC transporter permease [Deltaproteobacteria bacterium]